MMRQRWPWVVTGAVGVVLVAGGVVWLFLVLGAEKADRISSGIGAGAAVVGLVMALLGWLRVRSSVRDTEGAAAHSGPLVQNSVIMGSNIQVGGSVAGDITADGLDSRRHLDRGGSAT